MNNVAKLPRATIEQKITVLDYLKGPPQRSQNETYIKFSRDCAFAFSQATLSNWVLNEHKIRLEFSQGGGNTSQYKRKPVLKYPQLTTAVENDIRVKFQIGDSISDKTLRDLFTHYIKKLGVSNDFKLSSGMLHSFKRRNGIHRGKYMGNIMNVIAVTGTGTNAGNTETTSLTTTSNNSSNNQGNDLDFDFNSIFNNNEIGFSTRLIHSDDNFIPLLNLVNDSDSLLNDNTQLTPSIQLQPQQQLQSPFPDNQPVILNEPSHESQQQLPQQSEVQVLENEKKHQLVSYPTYSNPFYSNAHYKRRHESSKKIGNPNSEKIEKILETITEGSVTLYNSGTSAIMGVLSYINPKTVFIDDNGYKGTHKVIKLLSKLTGLKKYNLNDLNSFSTDMLNDSIIILESPQNPLGYVHDLSHYSNLAILNKGCKLLVDSTLAPPPLQFPFNYGADFIVYSAVKYLAGVSDLSAGFVVSRDNNIKMNLQDERSALGTSIANFDSFLLLRSLRTYRMRIITQCLNTEKLIKYLQQNFFKYESVVQRIHHSSLQANNEKVMKQLNGYYNPVFAIEMKMSWMIDEVLNGFKFLSNNPNLEGGETLVEKVRGNPSFTSNANNNDNMIRFSIGCEDFQDIIRDVDQSLINVVKKCTA